MINIKYRLNRKPFEGKAILSLKGLNTMPIFITCNKIYKLLFRARTEIGL